MPALEKCRSCHKAVRFVETLKGKTTPLDPEPRPDGTIVMGFDGRARYLSKREQQCRVCGCTRQIACPVDDGYGGKRGCSWVELDLCSACVGKEPVRYVSHFASCPQAREWRKAEATRQAVERVREATKLAIEEGRTAIEGLPRPGEKRE